MKNMNNKAQGAIIAMSIGVILLVVILGVIFSTLSEQTSTTSVIGDQFTGINKTCVRITPNCYTPNTLVIVNGTNGLVVATGNFTECGDSSAVLFGALGNIVDCDTCEDTLALNASYTGRSCGFITSGTTRTLINLLPVLLGIAVLIFILGFIALKR